MNWLVAAGQIVTIITTAATIAWLVIKERNKAKLDKAQADQTDASTRQTDVTTSKINLELENMARESDIWRDTRLWQLETYLNVDLGWHLQVVVNQHLLVAAIEQLKEMVYQLGENTDHIKIPDQLPPPPPIPEHPKR